VYQRALPHQGEPSLAGPTRSSSLVAAPGHGGLNQQNAGNRGARHHSRRSHATGEGEVMCSHRVQLSALILRSISPLLNRPFRVLCTDIMQYTATYLHLCSRPCLLRISISTPQHHWSNTTSSAFSFSHYPPAVVSKSN
jgi:hypothetical protein